MRLCTYRAKRNLLKTKNAWKYLLIIINLNQSLLKSCSIFFNKSQNRIVKNNNNENTPIKY